jgi:PAS domain S-box-containing protein
VDSRHGAQSTGHDAFLRWAVAFAAFLLLDVVLTASRDMDDLVPLFGADRDGAAASAMVALAVQAMVVACAAGLVSAYFLVRRRLLLREDAIASASATGTGWVWETDRDGVLIYSSEGVRHLLGYSPDEVVGRPSRELLTASERDRGDAVLATAVDSGSGWQPLELSWHHADGHVVVLQGGATPILDEHGFVTGFRGTRRRLTDAMLNDRDLAAAHKRLSDVLAAKAIDVALQPIIDVATGDIAGVEALSRFRDGRPPHLWFAEAVETGLGLELDLLAFVSALAVLPEIPAPIFLSINVTPELLADRAFQRVLLEADVPAERLVIEITEHERVASYDELAEALTPIRKRGVRLAVDDTGAGYASLSHVLQLRPDTVKLDRSLVSHVPDDPARRAIITALVLLGLELRAAVTAEGVETQRQLETLGSLGVDHVQGYLLARPTVDRAEWVHWWTREWFVGGQNSFEG